MRVLLTTDTVGGVWTFTRELILELIRRRHSVHLVAFGRDPSPEQADLLMKLRELYPDTFGYTASDIPLEWMQTNERAYPDGAALLEDVLRSTSPDLILTSQFCFGRLETPVPRIVVAHSDVLSWARACRPSALEQTPWLDRYICMVQAGLLEAAAVIAPTEWMGQALSDGFSLPTGYVAIPNGTRTPVAEQPTRERQLQVITAGRMWDEAKGLDTFQSVPLPMPVLVAGDDNLERSPDRNSALQMLGHLKAPDLYRHFRESAIYLCASRYEPFGLAPLEAALCGCAVVARDLPSLREVWGDGALYFDDPQSMSAVLQRLADNPRVLAQAQRAAQSRAEQFTPERMTDAYLDLFHAVLKSPVAHAV